MRRLTQGQITKAFLNLSLPLFFAIALEYLLPNYKCYSKRRTRDLVTKAKALHCRCRRAPGGGGGLNLQRGTSWAATERGGLTRPWFSGINRTSWAKNLHFIEKRGGRWSWEDEIWKGDWMIWMQDVTFSCSLLLLEKIVVGSCWHLVFSGNYLWSALWLLIDSAIE